MKILHESCPEIDGSSVSDKPTDNRKEKTEKRLIPIWNTTLKLHRRYTDWIFLLFLTLVTWGCRYTDLPQRTWFRIASKTTGLEFYFDCLPSAFQEMLPNAALILCGVGFIYQTVWIIILHIQKQSVQGRKRAGLTTRQRRKMHHLDRPILGRSEIAIRNAEHRAYLSVVADRIDQNNRQCQDKPMYRVQTYNGDMVMTEKEFLNAYPNMQRDMFEAGTVYTIGVIHVTKII